MNTLAFLSLVKTSYCSFFCCSVNGMQKSVVFSKLGSLKGTTYCRQGGQDLSVRLVVYIQEAENKRPIRQTDFLKIVPDQTVAATLLAASSLPPASRFRRFLTTLSTPTLPAVSFRNRPFRSVRGREE